MATATAGTPQASSTFPPTISWTYAVGAGFSGTWTAQLYQSTNGGSYTAIPGTAVTGTATTGGTITATLYTTPTTSYYYQVQVSGGNITGSPVIGTSLYFFSAYQGPQGVQGNPGVQGSQGAQGPAGTQGPQGVQGIVAINGFSGSNQLITTSTTVGAVNANPTLVYTSTGLGVNCNNPAYTLDVKGTVRGSNIVGTGTNAYFPITAVSPFCAMNGGINTTSAPQFELQFNTSGYTHFIGSRHDAASGNINTNAIDFYVYNGGSNATPATVSTTPGTGNLLVMSVTAAGVGMFNSNPVYPLDVAGVISTRGGSTQTTKGFATMYPGTTTNTGFVEFWSPNAGTRYGYIGFATSTGIDFSNSVPLRICPSVSIGATQFTPTYTLDVTGTIRATVDVTVTSDIRTKTNVETLSNALSKVNALRGVSYTSKADPSVQKIGVIAQEIEKVLPEVVMTDTSPEQTKSVTYGNITAVLIEAIKELTQRLQSLEKLMVMK